MAGVCRLNVDSAGGIIIGMNQDGTVFANGAVVSVDVDAVQGHGPGVHAGPVMVATTGTVFINGIAVCREGDQATCGHPATGSGDVHIGA